MSSIYNRLFASNLQYIHQLSRSAHVPNYICIGHWFLPWAANSLKTPTLLIFGSACLRTHATVGQKYLCFYAIRLKYAYLWNAFISHPHSFPFPMTYLEMDIIFSRFFLLKYSPYPMIALFFYSPGM